MKWLLAAALIIARTAEASSVVELDGNELYAGAERVVEGTVVARTVTWDATRTGLETHAWIEVSATLKGAKAGLVEIVVPGGELDGGRHVIVGMPVVNVGDQARWYLAPRRGGGLRVYGWAQGMWPARTTAGVTTFAPSPLRAEHATTAKQFTTNGMVWPASRIPVPYLIHTAGSQDLTLPQVTAAFDAAFAIWEAVPCASLGFTNAGTTNLGMAIDGENIMLFIESGWMYGAESAAATSLWIIDGQQTADIAVNGEHFTWANGPPGSGVQTNLLDLQAVMTHEIGHFSGLGHSMRAYDTMYYSWKPWPGQRTLSIDDKLGLCSVYGTAGSECPAPACPTDETCATHPLGMLCTGTPDPVGAACNYDRVECDEFCLFTDPSLGSGYCSKFCTTHQDCPPTHHCDEASAGSMTVKVCFSGPPPAPDAGVGPCSSDESCPQLQHCDVTNGACTFDCRNSEDCGAGSTCDGRGYCVALGSDGGGCGCRGASGATAWFGMLVLGLLLRRRQH
ncbi:MAG TPA: matrixin family metalloprotease [Kofleriaceae bacterium]